jgi:hypothetical protein
VAGPALTKAETSGDIMQAKYQLRDFRSNERELNLERIGTKISPTN